MMQEKLNHSLHCMQQKQKAKTLKEMLKYIFMTFVDFNNVFVNVKIFI